MSPPPNTRDLPFLGAIEAGGTKFRCAAGRSHDDIDAATRIPTSSPSETLDKVTGFFRRFEKKHGRLHALGVASFGPIDLRPTRPTFGCLTTTPKQGWAGFDLIGTLRRELAIPVAFDTDVNGAALAEWKWGAAQGRHSCLYVTVGTGIGGGFVLDGRPIHGLFHPEMGHLLIRRDSKRDPFRGICRFHGDCLEGLASGPAIEARWNIPSGDLPPAHPGWDLQAGYLAQAVVQWILTLSPETIVLGGGVMKRRHVFPIIRKRVRELLNGYLPLPEILTDDKSYICPPGLGDRSGICGAFALAAGILKRARTQ